MTTEHTEDILDFWDRVERSCQHCGEPEGQTCRVPAECTNFLAAERARAARGVPTKADAPSLIDRIKEHHAQVFTSRRTMTHHAIECGKLLLELKAEIDHGSWIPTVESIGMTQQTAFNRMRLAELELSADEVIERGGITAVLKSQNFGDLAESPITQPDTDGLRLATPDEMVEQLDTLESENRELRQSVRQLEQEELDDIYANIPEDAFEDDDEDLPEVKLTPLEEAIKRCDELEISNTHLRDEIRLMKVRLESVEDPQRAQFVDLELNRLRDVNQRIISERETAYRLSDDHKAYAQSLAKKLRASGIEFLTFGEWRRAGE